MSRAYPDDVPSYEQAKTSYYYNHAAIIGATMMIVFDIAIVDLNLGDAHDSESIGGQELRRSKVSNCVRACVRACLVCATCVRKT